MRIHRDPIRLSLLLCLLVASVSGAKNDSLKTIKAFPSPIPHPRTIGWDGDHFWIANTQTPYVYKLDQDMRVTDSIYTAHARISGIAFRNSRMWIAVDSVAYDTLIEDPTASHEYGMYRIYGLDPENRSLVDSIAFAGTATNTVDTGYIYGLASHGDTFHVTIHSGYSSGLYAIDSAAGKTRLVDFLPLSGISFLGDVVWGMRWNGDAPEAVWLTNLARQVDSVFVLDFLATDVAFDGERSLFCDMRGSRLVQTDLPTAAAAHTARRLRSKPLFREGKARIQGRKSGAYDADTPRVNSLGRRVNSDPRANLSLQVDLEPAASDPRPDASY